MMRQAGLAGAAVLCTAFLVAGPGGAATAPPRLTIAVLPFVGKEVPGSEGMAQSLAEALSHGLGQVRALSVVPPAVLEKGLTDLGLEQSGLFSDEALQKLGRALPAEAVVEGHFAVDGGTLQVGARIVDRRGKGDIVAVGSTAGPLADLFSLEERLAAGLLEYFKVRPTPADERRLAGAFATPTGSLASYALYAEAKRYLSRETKEGYEKAAELFGKALELDPNFALAHYHLGVVLQATNNRWRAAGEYRKAIQLKPDYAEAYKRLGDLLVTSPRRLYDQAIEAYAKAIEISPDFGAAYVGLGDARQAKGQFDQAIGEYRRALGIDPDNPRVHYGLGRIYYNEKGMYHEAVAEYRRAIEIDPAFVEAHLSLGEIYEDKGLYPEAIAAYRRVIDIDPKHPAAHYGLALAYENVDRDRAIRAWERYIEIATTTSSEKDWLDIAKKHLQKLRQEKP